MRVTSLARRTQVISYQTAFKWVDAVTSLRFAYQHGEFALFRGCCDFRTSENGAFKHGLVPGALRSPHRKETAREQCVFEMKILRKFAEHANRAGMALPRGIGPAEVCEIARRDWWVGRTDYGGLCHYPLELLELAALAQHHGCPTRLLDWTTDRAVAAHFAATSAMKSSNGDGIPVMVVWVLKAPNYCARSFTAPTPDPMSVHHGDQHPLLRVDLPMGANPRLHAQRGTFLMAHPSHEAIAGDPDWYVAHDDLRHLVADDGPPAFVAHVAPASEAMTALHFLATYFDITESRLYQSLDHVAEQTKREIKIR